MRLAGLVAMLMVAGCSRGSGGGDAGAGESAGAGAGADAGAGAGAGAGADAGAGAGAGAPAVRPPLPPAPAGEAVRSTLTSLDREPLLRAELVRLREHFGGDAGKDARGPFSMQRAELAGGRSALLLSRPDESDPIVLALDRDQLLFAKERPTAGIASPAEHPVIAPGPEGGVAVFTWVSRLRLVAARMWADDANPYAELEVFHPAACDELHVAYAPKAGWVVACGSKDGAVAQRLKEDLTCSWAREGIAVGTASPVAHLAIAFDSPSSWKLTERASAVGGDRTVTFRYGLDGASLDR